jgi:hypothetical protein
MACVSDLQPSYATPVVERNLLLFDVLVKDFRDFARALLRIALLPTLVVDIGNAETCRVALGPLKVAAGTLCQCVS